MGDSGAQVSGFVLCHMRIADMRPREDFERFDQVQVIGTGITGRIERIDADRRLAWLITPNKDGWWYLKDLEILKDQNHESTKKTKSTEPYFLTGSKHIDDITLGRDPNKAIELFSVLKFIPLSDDEAAFLEATKTDWIRTRVDSFFGVPPSILDSMVQDTKVKKGTPNQKGIFSDCNV